MKVLFDHNVPRPFRACLVGHEVKTTGDMGWERLKNGKLIQAASDAGFEVFLSIDKNIRHEQNLNKLPLPVVILDCASNALPVVVTFTPHVRQLLNDPLQKLLHFVAADGGIVRMGKPSET